MLRSSHIGLGLAVTALLAFQLSGCGSGGGGGGSGKGGTTGTGGSSSPGTGGSSTPGTGGSPTPGTGGSSAGGTGGTAAGGSGGTGTSGFGQPACGNTAAGTSIAKGVPCTAADTQLCYKTCGPQTIGRKSETCGAGADGGVVYAEMTGCSYDPAGSYACYKIPT